MADDNVWRRGGSRRGGRGRGEGGGGRRGYRKRGASHPLSRDDGSDDYPMERERERYNPYSRRAHMDNQDEEGSGSKGSGDRPSVFSRIGGNGGGGGGGGRGRSSYRGGGGGRPSHGRSSWHKVTIWNGGSQSREWLMRTLKESISEPFMAVQTHQLGDKVMFYVDDSRAADQLKSLGSITSKDGDLRVVVKPSPPPKGVDGGSRGGGTRGGARTDSRRGGGGTRSPLGGSYDGGRRDGDEDMSGDITMTENVGDIIQEVLASRYSNGALNLSNMFSEPRFREHRVRASMFDRKFVETVLNIIGDVCPELQELNLSNNRLKHLGAYTLLPVKCSKLSVLDLSSNEIADVSDVEQIKGMMSVTRLSFQGNPVARNFQDLGVLGSSVRKYFPNLQFLDGQSLPSPVKFDIPTASTNLPAYVKNFIVSEEAKKLVIQFIEQYYSCYDGTSRDKLLEAYGEEAMFSLCVISTARDPQMQKYISKSRNLSRVKEDGKRQSLLKRGRIDIVQMLRDMPATKHYTDLFEVDIVRASGSEIYFKIYGVFSEEGDQREALVRSFTRSFILYLNGPRVIIMNDMMSISSASPRTTQHIKDMIHSSPFSTTLGGVGSSQLPRPQANVAAGVIPIAMPVAGIAPNPAVPLASAMTPQQDAILKLAEATKMNLDYCEKCLSENNWDLSAAVTIFQSLQIQGKIPREAFL